MNKKLLQMFLIFNLGINNIYTTHTVNQSEIKKSTTSNNDNLIQPDQNINDSLSDTFLDKVENFVCSELFLYGSAICYLITSIALTKELIKQYQNPSSFYAHKTFSWIESFTKKYPETAKHLDNAIIKPSNQWATSKYLGEKNYTPTIYFPIISFIRGLDSVDEGCLLHEIGHIDFNKNHPILGQLYIPLTSQTYLSLLAGTGLSIKHKKPFLFSLFGGGYLSALLPGKINENAADNYVSKHADKKTLLALSDYFRNLHAENTQKNEDLVKTNGHEKTTNNNCLPFKTAIKNIIQCFADPHQSNSYRAQKFQKAADAKNA